MVGLDVLLSFVDRLSIKKKYLLSYLSKNGIGLTCVNVADISSVIGLLLHKSEALSPGIPPRGFFFFGARRQTNLNNDETRLL